MKTVMIMTDNKVFTINFFRIPYNKEGDPGHGLNTFLTSAEVTVLKDDVKQKEFDIHLIDPELEKRFPDFKVNKDGDYWYFGPVTDPDFHYLRGHVILKLSVEGY